MILSLGPMAGYTDAPYRSIASDFGANHTTTELVSAMGLIHAHKNMEVYDKLLYVNDNENNCAAQLFGKDAQIITAAAKILEKKQKYTFIDINMGCPVKKVVSNGEGSALMKTPQIAYDIVKSLKDNISLPISVKMRIGWDSSTINAVEFAKNMERAGADRIAVHGRTREMFYSGKADWNVIADVKSALTIPVIANGDIDSLESALNILNTTHCDGVMIGRAAMGNPWIFKEIDCYFKSSKFFKPTNTEKLNVILKHFKSLISFYGEKKGLQESKSQLIHYFSATKDSKSTRINIVRSQTKEEIKKAIQDFFKDKV